MQSFKNERGSVIFEAVLVALVLVATGSAFYFANKARTTKNDYSVVVPKSKTSATSATTVKVSADPYAGWKTYTYPTEGVSFRYPADWELVANQANATVRLKGPYNFRFNFMDNSKSDGSVFGVAQVHQTENITVPHLGNLYIIQSGVNAKTNDISLTDQSYQLNGAMGGVKFGYKGKLGTMSFDGSYASSTDLSSASSLEFDASTFSQKPEVIIAQKILRSITY